MASLAASGKVEIQNPEKPLGERVFTLNGADDQSGLLSWQAAEVGAATKTTSEDNGAALRRIKADLPVARGGPQAAQIRHDPRHHRSARGREDAVGRRVRRPRFAELRRDGPDRITAADGHDCRSDKSNGSRIFRDRRIGR